MSAARGENEPVLLESLEEGVLRLVMNRPAARNAVSTIDAGCYLLVPVFMRELAVGGWAGACLGGRAAAESAIA